MKPKTRVYSAPRRHPDATGDYTSCDGLYTGCQLNGGDSFGLFELFGDVQKWKAGGQGGEATLPVLV